MSISPVKEFEVPADIPERRCAHCVAFVVWITIKHGVHVPLAMNTLKRRGDKWYARAHICRKIPRKKLPKKQSATR